MSIKYIKSKTINWITTISVIIIVVAYYAVKKYNYVYHEVYYIEMNNDAFEGKNHELQLKLAQKWVDINHIDKHMPYSILGSAVHGNQVSTVNMLLQNGANPKSGIEFSDAIEMEHTDIVKLFIQHGSKLNDHNILAASNIHNTELINYLLTTTDIKPIDFINLSANSGNKILLQCSLVALKKDKINNDKQKMTKYINNAIVIARMTKHNNIESILDDWEKKNF